jgi:hypothetical protein
VSDPESPERDGASPESEDASLLRAAPGLARIAAGAWWRTAGWTAGAYARVGSRLLKAASSGQSAADLIQDAHAELRQQARRILRDTDGDEAAEATPRPEPTSRHGTSRPETLRDRGADLLRRSADVRDEESAHPAYERILSELAPDEARILRLFAQRGPQPAIDVRASRVPVLSSELIAPGLNMIGAEAGVRYLERVPAYLNNLYRLGLIWFSREPLSDPLRYQVLEAQPEVLTAMRGASRGKTVRRSIYLTPFGEDFCRVCLPLDTAEIDALAEPGEQAPDT